MSLFPVPNDTSQFLEASDYIWHSLAENTLKAYRNDLEHFRAWGGTIPCTPEVVAGYLSSHAHVLAIATLQRRLVAIRRAHAARSLNDPTKTEAVRLTFRGIQRVHGKPQRRVSPLMRDDLIVMLSLAPDNLKGHRDRALLCLAFCAALRRSELVSICVEHVQFSNEGLILTLPRSKTDQIGEGRRIAIPRGKGRICPVDIVDFWLKKSAIKSGFLFRSVSKGGYLSVSGLSDRSVPNIIKAYAEKAGLDARIFSGHSPRSGLCTSAAQQGVSSWKIRAQTGHKSDATLARYVRDGDIFRDNAADLF